MSSTYIPNTLSENDKKKQKKFIKKSRKLYRDKKYYTRPKLKSFKSKTSRHIIKAYKLYNIKSMKPDKILSKKTGCSLKGLKQIIKKGEGAYYSSGSRPNQTAQSWAYARLASALTGGNSSRVDYHILEKECKKHSLALKLAKKKL